MASVSAIMSEIKYKYKQLSDGESASSENEAFLESNGPTQKPQRSRSKWLLMNLGKAGVILLAIVGVATVITQAHHWLASPPGHFSCACGNNAEEAIAMGCKFDILATAWLPDHCRDEALTEEFNHAGPGPDGEWPYFLDINGSIPLTVEEVSLLPKGTFWYGVYNWHVRHCFFYWRKQYRARYQHNIVEGKYDSEFHIMHCLHQTEWQKAPLSIANRAMIAFNADHSSHEAEFTDHQREMFSIDHDLTDGVPRRVSSNY
ncbi:hypothetical protein AOQ84DRAFT_323709 [Glonium stellatum]|uniref:Uncharacterized protein n=1 Tax=Glonium stellatum TaxID=574774 RepID=A0A8E2JPP0_9PEZI|nr:hypothetical protein AOQ84DRAFT_323709 [Glonium stellatum]